MHITISLHGVFRIDRFKKETFAYPDGSTAQDIIDKLQIPVQLLGIILVNGTHANSETVLVDGDTLMLLPLLEGG
ncbi:MoaD/ThiS family protein [uncultured Desulfuromusa sp.]|uniref:MoaD/ThiS family protein n=1 Tax=uncultured Desulfuromusa sp. TaxID=219183 RepID=UPI002AA70193|nr:MoaD/ThiS family protein [uncultured Desulfuromusa sp.]